LCCFSILIEAPHTETKQRIESRILFTLDLKTGKNEPYRVNSASEVKVLAYLFPEAVLAERMLMRRYVEAVHDFGLRCFADAR